MDWSALIQPAIVAAVPLLTMFAKKVIPDRAKVAIPLVAVAFGPVLEAVASGLQSQPASPGKGLLLGAAGVALREVVDQAKKINAPSVAPLILLPFLLLAPMIAEAWVPAPDGVFPEWQWTEPTTNTDASPLIDLASYRVFYKLGSGTEQSFNVPATSATPPANSIVKVTNQKVSVLPCQTVSMTTQVVAVDTMGNQSARSSTATALIDRKAGALEDCPPNTPLNMTVK